MHIKIAYPIKIYKVPSRSNKAVIYEVELESDGKLYCNCPAGQMMRKCWHKDLIKDKIDKDHAR